MDDIESNLSQMEALLAEARPVPLSASVMVNRQDFDELIAGIRSQMPEELRQSRWVIKERDDLLAQARREGDQVVADARAEQERMMNDTEMVRAARREADRIVEEAREQARVLRLEAEDYVDSKLANFEIVLGKTLKTVQKGRERLRGRMDSDALTGEGREEEEAFQTEGTAPRERQPAAEARQHGGGGRRRRAAEPAAEPAVEPAAEPSRGAQLFDHEARD